MKLVPLSVLSLCFVATCVHAQDSKPAAGPPKLPFDGTRWIVVLKPDAEAEKLGERNIEDTLVFEDSKLLSMAGKQNGFPAGKYEAGQKWARAEIQTTDQRAKCEWQLEPGESEIKGTMVATRIDGSRIRYSLTGQRATPLEGTRWAIQLEPDAEGRKAGEKPRDDTLVFARNMVSSTGAGLPPTVYTLTKGGGIQDPETLNVSVERILEHGGRVRWTAEFSGDTVKGLVVSAPGGGAQQTHVVQGKRITSAGDSAPNEAGVRIKESKDPEKKDEKKDGR